MKNYKRNIHLYKNKIKKINKKIHRIKKPQELSFFRALFKWFLILFVAWPIIIFLIESVTLIIYLIIGLISYLFLGIDITSEGTPVSNFMISILYPHNDIFFYALMTWKHFLIVFLTLVIALITIKLINYHQIRGYKEKVDILTKEKNKIKKKLDDEIKEHEKEQEAKGLIKYKSKWGTPKQVKKWKEVEYGIDTNFMNMSHFEFEEFIAKLFRKMGYDVIVTRKTGDYGIDIIAKDKKDTIAIQVKQNKIGNNVGNTTIQQVLGAMWKVKANKAIIITTSDFTIQAKEQAKEAPVELWDLKTLKRLVQKYFIDMDEMKND
jgi:HJR/Mrr/RecB family endonuclease